MFIEGIKEPVTNFCGSLDREDVKKTQEEDQGRLRSKPALV